MEKMSGYKFTHTHTEKGKKEKNILYYVERIYLYEKIFLLFWIGPKNKS